MGKDDLVITGLYCTLFPSWLSLQVNLSTWKRVPEQEKAEFLRRKLAYAEQDQDLTVMGMEAY